MFREFREYKGLTQSEVGRLSGVSRQCVAQFENGILYSVPIVNFLMTEGLVDFLNKEKKLDISAKDVHELRAELFKRGLI